MSLINDALKKAQYERHDDFAGVPIPVTAAAGETRSPRWGRPHSANSMVLFGSAALVLVVLSVVLTVVLVNQPAKPDSSAIKSTPAPTAATSAPAASATPVPPSPVPTQPAVDAHPPRITVPIAATPAVTPAPTTSQTNAPALVVFSPVTNSQPAAGATANQVAPSLPASNPPPATVTPIVKAPGRDERVSSFVEAVRVSGIRSYGNESRVLMNEKVVRVNDIVERTLGVRLTAVSADSLTFTDANGVTYVKTF